MNDYGGSNGNDDYSNENLIKAYIWLKKVERKNNTCEINRNQQSWWRFYKRDAEQMNDNKNDKSEGEIFRF